MQAVCAHNEAMAALAEDGASPLHDDCGAWAIQLTGDERRIAAVLAQAQILRERDNGWDGFPLCEGHAAYQKTHTVLLPRSQAVECIDKCEPLGAMLLELGAHMPNDVCLSQVQFLWQDLGVGQCVVFRYHTDSPQESNDTDRGSGKILLTGVTLLSGNKPPHLKVAGKKSFGEYKGAGHTLVFCADCVHRTQVQACEGRDHFAVNMVTSWEHVPLPKCTLVRAHGELGSTLSHAQLLGACMASESVTEAGCVRMGTQLISAFDSLFIQSASTIAARYVLRCMGVALAVFATMVTTPLHQERASKVGWLEVERNCKALRDTLRLEANQEGLNGAAKLYGAQKKNGSSGRLKRDVYKLLDLLICSAAGASLSPTWMPKGDGMVEGMVGHISSRMQHLNGNGKKSVYSLVEAFVAEQVFPRLPAEVQDFRVFSGDTGDGFVPRKGFQEVWQKIGQQKDFLDPQYPRELGAPPEASEQQPPPKRRRRAPAVEVVAEAEDGGSSPQVMDPGTSEQQPPPKRLRHAHALEGGNDVVEKTSISMNTTGAAGVLGELWHAGHHEVVLPPDPMTMTGSCSEGVECDPHALACAYVAASREAKPSNKYSRGQTEGVLGNVELSAPDAKDFEARMLACVSGLGEGRSQCEA